MIQEWQTTVEGALATVGSAEAGAGQFTVQPALAAAVDALGKGEPTKDTRQTADAASSAMSEAAKTLEGVDLPTLIRDRGLDVATANYVLNSRARMLNGLELYERVAAIVDAATAEDVDPALVEALSVQATELLPLAQRVFDEGYTDYTSALASVGLLQPTPGLPGASGLPGGSGLPGSGLGEPAALPT